MKLAKTGVVGHGIGVVIAAALVAACANVTLQLEQDILIQQVTVVSPHLDAPLLDQDVAIHDGSIVAIGKNIRAGAAVRRIDGRGRYLIPGLIDTHVHIGHVIALDDASIEERPELEMAYLAQVPRSYLAFGFTTLVDLDITPQERRSFEETPMHPRLFHCGRGVRVPGGYGALRVPQNATDEDFPYLVYEVNQSARWPSTLEPREHTPERIVERIAADGGICVKAFVESGFGQFDWPVLSPGTLEALREQATKHELAFVVHANSVESWQAALAANPDVIAHSLWYWPGERLETEPPAQVRNVIEDAARRGVSVQPTLRVVRNDRAIFDPALLDDPRIARALPAAVLTNLKSERGRAGRRALMEIYERAAAQSGEAVGAARLIDAAIARVTAVMRLMVDQNVRFAFGSDTPSASGQSIGNPPGLNGRLELQHWADSGVPLAEIFRAATLSNAETFGLAGQLGTIEVSKRADLLLLTSNPLEDVNAYDSIEIIFLGGVPLTVMCWPR